MVTNWLAAPLAGMLASRVEQYLVSDLHRVDERPLWQEIHHAFRREWQKLKYWLPRMLLCAILFLFRLPVSFWRRGYGCCFQPG